MTTVENERLEVACPDFIQWLNCSSTELSENVQQLCCTNEDNVVEQNARKHYYSSLMKCCDELSGGVHAKKPDSEDWENGSYQAYVMGVAVFSILICLFVSGARSVRRRRLLLRARQMQLATASGNLPEINTQISLGPPTYGELEASGLTKDYKMGILEPPPYPGTTEDDDGEYIHCVPPPLPSESSSCSGNPVEVASGTGGAESEPDDSVPPAFGQDSQQPPKQ